MPKPRAATKKSEPTASSKLVEALRFVKLAQREIGEPYQTHVVISNNTIIAYDGTLAAGIYIEENIEACPQTSLLLDVLSKIKGPFSIGQTSKDKLLIKADKLESAYVPCVDSGIMPNIAPDASVAPITNEFIKGLNIVAGIAHEKATRVDLASILIRKNSMVATDGHIMFEYWHGLDLPTFALPKAAAAALCKCGKELVSFGFSGHSATFYFSDNSFIRSQLYETPWPDVEAIVNVTSNPYPVPQSFFDGVRAVYSFNDDARVMFDINMLSSHGKDAGKGASYVVQGVPGGVIFDGEYLLMLEGVAKTIDFVATADKAAFFGDKLRGVLMQIKPAREPLQIIKQEYRQPTPTYTGSGEADDDIPF